MRKRAPLSICHAVVGEAMGQQPYIVTQTALRRVEELRRAKLVRDSWLVKGSLGDTNNGKPYQVVVCV